MEIVSITLKSRTGLCMQITNYGATLMRLQVPDKAGKLTDVVVGLPNAQDYAASSYHKHHFYLGATVGRYAGRISRGGFTIDNTFYAITHQDGVQLHGGVNALDKQVWEVTTVQEGEHPLVRLSTTSPTGDNGFPGNLKVTAQYQLVDNALNITYTATTDAPTVLNLTNHAYFNLNGMGSVAGHQLYVNSVHVLEVDERLVPTGRLQEVAHTPYDYSTPIALLFEDHYGLDTPFVLQGDAPQAVLASPITDIQMQVHTNQPCVVLFTPQDLSTMPVRDKEAFKRFPAICLECQNFPDAPNQPHFPTPVLRPNEMYRNEIEYKFYVL